MPWIFNVAQKPIIGIYPQSTRRTRNFLGVASQEILEEIFFKEWPEARNQSSDLRRNLYGNKIFKKILTENALEFLASGKGFIGDRIGDARHLK